MILDGLWIMDYRKVWLKTQDFFSYLGWGNCQVGLFLFLSYCFVATKIWRAGLNVVEQQTSYSSVQLKQTDLLLVRHSPKTPHPSYQCLLTSPFILPVSSFWLCPVQSRACTHQQRKCKWAYTQGRIKLSSYITAALLFMSSYSSLL